MSATTMCTTYNLAEKITFVIEVFPKLDLHMNVCYNYKSENLVARL